MSVRVLMRDGPCHNDLTDFVGVLLLARLRICVASSAGYCVTALAVALLASFIATAVFSPPFSVYFTVTFAPCLAARYVSTLPVATALPVASTPFTVVCSVYLMA